MSVRLFIDINESRMREYCRLRNDSERDNFIMDSLRDIFNRYCTAQDTSSRRASSNREYTAAASAAGSLINWTPCNSNKFRAAWLIYLKRSGPRSTPPNQRETTTAMLLTTINLKISASLDPAAFSPSSSQS